MIVNHINRNFLLEHTVFPYRHIHNNTLCLLYMHHIGQYRSSEREREREMLLNLKQNVCCQNCISELFEIVTSCGGYLELCLHIISYLDYEHKK